MKPHSRQLLVHVPKLPNGKFVNDAMQHPVRMDRIWYGKKDSRFKSGVAIYKLYPQDEENYECIGNVARETDLQGNLEEVFDFKKYACLNKRFLTEVRVAEFNLFFWLIDTQLCGVFAPLEFSRSKFLIHSLANQLIFKFYTPLIDSSSYQITKQKLNFLSKI